MVSRPTPSPDDRLTTNFNAFWERLSQQLKEIVLPTARTESRTIDDMISEVLTILRGTRFGCPMGAFT